MKRILAMLLALVMVMGCAACGAANDVSGELKEDTGDTADDTSSQIDLSMGHAEGNVYENEFLGIGFHLPEGYTFYTQEQINEMNNLTNDMLDEDVQEQIENAALIYDMYATGADGSSVNVNIEKLNVVNAIAYTEEEYVDASLDSVADAMEQLGFTNVTSEATKMTFVGDTHAAINVVCEMGDVVLYETVVCVKVGQYIACITAGSLSEAGVEAILANFYAL